MVSLSQAELILYTDNHAVQSLDSNMFGEGIVLGCDFTGTVTALGAEVSLLEVGDIVSGLVWGGIQITLGQKARF